MSISTKDPCPRISPSAGDSYHPPIRVQDNRSRAGAVQTPRATRAAVVIAIAARGSAVLQSAAITRSSHVPISLPTWSPGPNQFDDEYKTSRVISDSQRAGCLYSSTYLEVDRLSVTAPVQLLGAEKSRFTDTTTHTMHPDNSFGLRIESKLLA